MTSSLFPIRRHSLAKRKTKTIPEILAPVSSSWKAWWTVFDPTLAANPGVAFTGTIGVDAVVTSWTDQRAGFVLSAVNSPPYAVDGAHFDGRPVIQCTTTGSKYLLGNLATVVASGSRPLIVIVYRIRGTADVPIQTSNAGTFIAGMADNGAATTRSYFQSPNGNMVTAAGFIDNNPHVMAGWVTASGGCFLARDGVTIVSAPASTAATAANMNRVAVGANRNGSSVTDSSICEVFIFSDYIGDAIFAELMGATQVKV